MQPFVITGLLQTKQYDSVRLARELGVSSRFIRMVICRQRKSRRVMIHIASILRRQPEEVFPEAAYLFITSDPTQRAAAAQ